MTRSIEDIRTEIDALDRRIVELIAERQGWVEEAGADADTVAAAYRAMIGAFIELELRVHDARERPSTPRR